jgi:predicted anti-sigma-YlaC factor YlaD
MGREPTQPTGIWRRRSDACATARAAVSAGLDGEANELELAAAQRHVEACPSCGAFARDAGLITEHVRAAAAALVPETALAPASPSRRRLPLRVAGGVATIAAAALLGAFVSTQVEQSQAPAPKTELRIANLNSREAQQLFLERQLDLLLGASGDDPTLDRIPGRRGLG